MQCDPKYDFPNPGCVYAEHSEIRWLDAVKLRHALDHDAVKHRDMFCTFAIKEMHELKRQSMLPHLSKIDLIKKLEAPGLGLVPDFTEELQMLSLNLKTRSELLQENLRSKNNESMPTMGEGGSFFSCLGDGIAVTDQMKQSWKCKLAAKVHYSAPNSEREQTFHDRMIAALETLHKQSWLEHAGVEQWHLHWSEHAFHQCEAHDRGMIKNITMEVFASNLSVCGTHFSRSADEAAAAAVSKTNSSAFFTEEAKAATVKTAVDAKWNIMLRCLLPQPCPPPLRLINLHMLSHLDVIKVA